MYTVLTLLRRYRAVVVSLLGVAIILRGTLIGQFRLSMLLVGVPVGTYVTFEAIRWVSGRGVGVETTGERELVTLKERFLTHSDNPTMLRDLVVGAAVAGSLILFALWLEEYFIVASLSIAIFVDLAWIIFILIRRSTRHV